LDNKALSEHDLLVDFLWLWTYLYFMIYANNSLYKL